jgi:hypothetical protein
VGFSQMSPNTLPSPLPAATMPSQLHSFYTATMQQPLQPLQRRPLQRRPVEVKRAWLHPPWRLLVNAKGVRVGIDEGSDPRHGCNSSAKRGHFVGIVPGTVWRVKRNDM